METGWWSFLLATRKAPASCQSTSRFANLADVVPAPQYGHTGSGAWQPEYSTLGHAEFYPGDPQCVAFRGTYWRTSDLADRGKIRVVVKLPAHACLRSQYPESRPRKRAISFATIAESRDMGEISNLASDASNAKISDYHCRVMLAWIAMFTAYQSPESFSSVKSVLSKTEYLPGRMAQVMWPKSTSSWSTWCPRLLSLQATRPVFHNLDFVRYHRFPFTSSNPRKRVDPSPDDPESCKPESASPLCRTSSEPGSLGEEGTLSFNQVGLLEQSLRMRW